MRPALLLIAATLLAQSPDPAAIVRRAVDAELAAPQPRDFTYRFREVEYKVSGNGARTLSKDETSEVLILYGRPFTRLTARNGQPLSGAEKEKIQRKFDKEVADRARLSDAERAREDEKLRKADANAREFIRQIPDLYAFTLRPSETLQGRPVYVIDAAPRQGARPRGLFARNASKLYARVYIDQQESRWAKADADVRDTVSFGLFLARIERGSHISFSQTRVAPGVWLPFRISGSFRARFFGAPVRIDSTTEFSDYRRFSTETRLEAAPE